MRAVSSMATRHVLADIAEAASAAGLPALEIESLGGVDAAERVRTGEPWDLVFLAEGALSRLAAEGHVDGASVTPIVVSSVAVAVPSAGDEPAGDPGRTAFADADAMRDAVAAASRIGYSTGPSGTALLALIEQWGLTSQVGDRLVQARPGIPVARLLAEGEVDLGFQQLSELVGQPGVRILGGLPEDCAITTVFAGAVATASADPARARDLLGYVASDAAAPLKTRHSFGVPRAAS